MDFYNKHYIRLDANGYIIKGFSDAFDIPLDTDICIHKEGGRHFELNGETNIPLVTIAGCHLYKYDDGRVIETTEAEKTAELAALSKMVESDPVAEYMIDLDFRLSLLELGVFKRDI